MQNTKIEGPADNADTSKENRIFLLKIHDDIVAAAEERFLGKIYEEGEIYLDLKKYGDFYMGNQSGRQELREALARMQKKGGSANLIGEPAEIAVELGFARKEEIKYIKGIALLQIYWV